MVLVKAKRDEILNPLSAVSGIIERRHTLPILSNVLIDRGASAVSFLATDIEIQITARSTLTATGEARAITVGARKLVDILRALPDNAEVTLDQQEKRLLVKAGKSRFTLQTMPAEDFPRLAKPAGDVARFELPQKALRRLLGLVQYAMAQQDIRYYLNGLLMVVEEKQLKLVATDGHRLAFASLKLAADLPRQEVIVPRKTVLELSKLLAEVDDEVKIEVSPAQAAIQLRGDRTGFEAGRRQVPGLHAGHSDGPQESPADRARGAAPGAAARGDSFQREVPRRTLGAQRRQPEDRVLERRAGRGARGDRGQVLGRFPGHRLQCQLSARRVEQRFGRGDRVRVR